MKYRPYSLFLVLLSLAPLALSTMCGAQEYRVQSPEGSLEVVFNLREGVPSYTLQYQGKEIIGESRLGVSLPSDIELDKDVIIVSTHRTPHHETWTQLRGEQREIQVHPD